MYVASFDDLERDVDEWSNSNCSFFAFKLEVEECFGIRSFPFEFRCFESFSIPSSDLSENPHSRVSVLVVERKRSKEFPQSNHHFVDDGSH